jgi:RNA polymerase sigma-70 factor (ECF subfamily)
VSANPSIEALANRLRAGDQDAAARVFRRYVHRLIGLASRRLDPLIRTKTDPEDVVQSVFRSFFDRQRQGQFELNNWEDLWSLLVVMTLRKCCGRAEHFHAACRDVRREVAIPAAANESGTGWEALDEQPTPEHAAQLVEMVEQVLRPFNDRERTIVQLSLDGCSVAEVSGRIGCSQRKVYRILERLKAELQRLQSDVA